MTVYLVLRDREGQPTEVQVYETRYLAEQIVAMTIVEYRSLKPEAFRREIEFLFERRRYRWLIDAYNKWATGRNKWVAFERRLPTYRIVSRTLGRSKPKWERSAPVLPSPFVPH